LVPLHYLLALDLNVSKKAFLEFLKYNYDMKRVALFLLLTVLSVSVHSQKISWDRIEGGGVRHIGAKGLGLKIDNASYQFFLTVFSGLYNQDYCLLISSVWHIQDNCVVLLKLGNDEIIKLVANNINKGEIDWPTYAPIIGGTKVSGVLTTQKVDYYSSIYSLDQESLNKIEKNGILKVRIQYGNTYKERSWNRDRLGKHIKYSHEQIELQLQKHIVSPKSIEENF
jgi:hypothetical protein